MIFIPFATNDAADT